MALGKSSLKPEDAHSDYSTLDESEMKVLEDWYKYFEKVGTLSLASTADEPGLMRATPLKIHRDTTLSARSLNQNDSEMGPLVVMPSCN